jgi:hypothetical protein
LVTLHCCCTIFRVSFFQEVWRIKDYSWYLNVNFLTARPLDCFQFTFLYKRGTFPIDYLVYHKRYIPEIVRKRKTYITKDPRYFKTQLTLQEWQDKIGRTPTHITVTHQEQVPISDPENPVTHNPYTLTTKNLKGIYEVLQVGLRNRRQYKILGLFLTIYISNEK